MGGGDFSPPFPLSVYDGRKRKAESDDGQHNGGTLEKAFHMFAPPLFELYFKDVPALISSRRLRVLSGVSPQASAARAVSQVRGGGGLSAPGSFCFVLPSFSFSFSSFDITILARLDFFCKWPAPFCFKCNIYNRPFLLCSLHKNGVISALYFCTGFTNFKASQNFFKADYCTNFVHDCTNCQFLPLFTLYSF